MLSTAVQHGREPKWSPNALGKRKGSCDVLNIFLYEEAPLKLLSWVGISAGKAWLLWIKHVPVEIAAVCDRFSSAAAREQLVQASTGLEARCQHCEGQEGWPCHLSLLRDCQPHTCPSPPLSSLPAVLIWWNRAAESLPGLCFKELRWASPVNSLSGWLEE